jgi:hypothetical protein
LHRRTVRSSERRPARNHLTKFIAALALLGALGVFPSSPMRGVTASAAAAWAPWTPNWNYASGYNDTWDYSDGASGEYGIDVNLSANTPVYAPEPGTVIAYQPAARGSGLLT